MISLAVLPWRSADFPSEDEPKLIAIPTIQWLGISGKTGTEVAECAADWMTSRDVHTQRLVADAERDRFLCPMEVSTTGRWIVRAAAIAPEAKQTKNNERKFYPGAAAAAGAGAGVEAVAVGVV